MLALLAVLLGHIYPIVFKGKGGKGISTFIGGLIAFDYLIALTLVAVFIIFYLILKGLLSRVNYNCLFTSLHDFVFLFYYYDYFKCFYHCAYFICKSRLKRNFNKWSKSPLIILLNT